MTEFNEEICKKCEWLYLTPWACICTGFIKVKGHDKFGKEVITEPREVPDYCPLKEDNNVK